MLCLLFVDRAAQPVVIAERGRCGWVIIVTIDQTAIRAAGFRVKQMNLRTRKQIGMARHGVAIAVAFCLISAVASVTGSGIGETAGAGSTHAVEMESPWGGVVVEDRRTQLCALFEGSGAG